jgi:hypothetical protein
VNLPFGGPFGIADVCGTIEVHMMKYDGGKPGFLMGDSIFDGF